MAEITQQYRPLRVVTGAGPDKLLITGFHGQEGLSQLYSYQLDLIAPLRSPVALDQVLGQPVAVSLDLPGGKTRFFHGVASRVSQGEADADFITYRAEVVPWLWFLTRRVQSRIFQHKSVPDILKEVLDGLDVTYQLQGTFHPRDYCVQYRESDFAFASRLMEEEGLFYFFRHEEKKAVLVVANTPQGHPELPVAKSLIFEKVLGGNRPEDRVYDWTKMQEIRSYKVTLWDHCFELPHKHLEAEKVIQDTVQVGSVAHKLKVGPVSQLELYDYPGEYAQRFDGVDPGGGDRAADLQKIFEDNARTAAIRMQEESARALRIDGSSSCRQLTAGHKFSLTKHINADGDYVLTGIQHSAQLEIPFRSGDAPKLEYQNRFTCIPAGLPFRPERNTPRPTVRGTQTAVVVGPSGEEIFTDKYGRVKVQFHWDRQGQNDADSSCWIRVGTVWAGQGWGVVHVPRIGQEVIVDFLEGDPDQPIIIGSVYNADQMPAFPFPDKAMVSGFKSNSTPGGGGYNEVTLDDTKGKEKITIHGQYDMNTTVEHDQTTTVHNNRTDTIDVDDTESVGSNQKCTVGSNRETKIGADNKTAIGGNDKSQIGGDQELKLGGNRTETVGGKEKVTIGGARELSVGGADKQAFSAAQTISISGDRATSVGGKDSLTVTGALSMDATGKVTITSPAAIELTCGGSVIKLDPAGITISAAKIDVTSPGLVTIKGSLVKVNS